MCRSMFVFVLMNSIDDAKMKILAYTAIVEGTYLYIDVSNLYQYDWISWVDESMVYLLPSLAGWINVYG